VFNSRKMLVITGIIGVVSLVVAGIGGFRMILDGMVKERIKGQFEFHTEKSNGNLTEDEAVSFAKIAANRAGLEVNSMKLVQVPDDDPSVIKYVFPLYDNDAKSGYVIFIGPPPDYYEYSVAIEKKGNAIEAKVVFGK